MKPSAPLSRKRRKDARGYPERIQDHPDPCPCPRCEGFTECPLCKRIKRDTSGDWCFGCRRMLF